MTEELKTNPTILAFESSCDDTSVAVLYQGKVISNVTASQEAHARYGGVVPEVASRAHMDYITTVSIEALNKAGIKLEDVDAIACTTGPGLMGSLVVGVAFSKTLAQVLGKPFIGVNHMQAHILAHFIDTPVPKFPFLCLTVSGGHTQIVLVNSYSDMEVLGKTIDDAAGEAFDKTGKLLGLPYPAGIHIDKLAQKGRPVFTFPEPQISGLDFSFSGLKTSILYFLQKEVKNNPDFIHQNLEDICSSVQSRIVSILLNKLKKASKEYKIKEIAIAGGVSANSGLRTELEKMAEKYSWKTYIPRLEYCTDNAAMIAQTALFKYQEADFDDLAITANPRMKI